MRALLFVILVGCGGAKSASSTPGPVSPELSPALAPLSWWLGDWQSCAFGAAYAAGLAVGFWKNVEDLRTNWAKDKEWKPKMDKANREKYYMDWKKAVTRTFDWVE